MAVLRRLNAKQVLESLRAEGAVEYGISGIDAIGVWFQRVGYAKVRPSRRTLYRWRQKEGCPFTARRAYETWTTNLLLMAWCAARVRRNAKRELTVSRRTSFRYRAAERDRAMVAEAMRLKMLREASAPPREAPGTGPTEPPSA